MERLSNFSQSQSCRGQSDLLPKAVSFHSSTLPLWAHHHLGKPVSVSLQEIRAQRTKDDEGCALPLPVGQELKEL